MEYKILREYGVHALQDLVNEHLKNGYKLHGFLITDENKSSPAYIQVVVK